MSNQEEMDNIQQEINDVARLCENMSRNLKYVKKLAKKRQYNEAALVLLVEANAMEKVGEKIKKAVFMEIARLKLVEALTEEKEG